MQVGMSEAQDQAYVNSTSPGAFPNLNTEFRADVEVNSWPKTTPTATEFCPQLVQT